jgi:hypothetical protein
MSGMDETTENPWIKDAGLLADHPCWDDFQEGIALARAEAEQGEQGINECTLVRLDLSFFRDHGKEGR